MSLIRKILHLLFTYPYLKEMETEKQNKMFIDDESQKEKLKQKQSAILTRPIVEEELMDEETTMAEGIFRYI